MRYVMAVVLAMCAGQGATASDAEKQKTCRFQADLMGAVQQARLERVSRAKASAHVLKQNSDWPAGVADAMGTVVSYVYSFKRRDLKKVDLAESTLTTCLENYDQIQALKNSVQN